MPSSVEKLQKFLKLEAERGYDNRAVVGGLDRIIPNWQNEARSENIGEEIVKQIVTRLSDYRYMQMDERVIVLKEMMELLQSVETTKQKTIPQTSKKQPKPEINQPINESFSPRLPKIVSKQQSTNVYQASPSSSAIKIALNTPLTVLHGVGPRTAENMQLLGLETLNDLLYYFPRRYDDYSLLKSINRIRFGDELTVIATIRNIQNRKVKNGKLDLTEAIVSDDTGFLRITWYNHPWYTNKFTPNSQVVLSGKIDMYLGRLVMNNPEIEMLEQEHLHTNRIVPVYPLIAQLNQYTLRRSMYQAVTFITPQIEDILPESIKQSADLLDLSTALLQIHFPDSQEQLHNARERLAFDEIFLLQLGLLKQKYNWQSTSARIYEIEENKLEERISNLPYQLTNAQRSALQDIRKDLESGKPMNRLLQGDVGSGKTIVAALAVSIISQYNVQSAIMAPTSILAEQHYRNLLNLLANPDQPNIVFKPEEVCLLIGNTAETEKETIRKGLKDGKIKLVIGTHALLEDPVTFNDLQLIIVDEQHRFGVAQRSTLREKGEYPHLLVMTATPIPRSMALTVYGDLDLSVIDEMPPGRQPVVTRLLHPIERERAYNLIRTQVEQDHQVFIIYPLVEKGDIENRDENQAAVEEYKRLQETVFPQYQLGLLHGRMKSEEKDLVMSSFRDRKIHILVSTSVIEVGIDIPNATIMLVEGANRFGLAQLHQFRGRIGRGLDQAYCLLIPESEDAVENQRLQALVETDDGFSLAERDLEQRGPGEFLGTRQSGFSELKIANITDYRLIEKARKHAQELFLSDPNLSKPEHQALVKAMDNFWTGGKGDVS